MKTKRLSAWILITGLALDPSTGGALSDPFATSQTRSQQAANSIYSSQALSIPARSATQLIRYLGLVKTSFARLLHQISDSKALGLSWSTITILAWLAFFAGVSYVDSELTETWVASHPAYLIPSLLPISLASVLASGQIARILAKHYPNPTESSHKEPLQPLLLLAVYSAIVEGPLYHWLFHDGIPLWTRIGVDIAIATPLFIDPMATYLYKRFAQHSHDEATAYVADKMPERILPLLMIWLSFSILTNSLSDPLFSFTAFSSGIIAWTVFFIWADDANFPASWENSARAWKRKFWSLNRALSQPLERTFRSASYRAMLRDLSVSLVSGFILGSLWLMTPLSDLWLYGIFMGPYVVWRGLLEMWNRNHHATKTGKTKETPDDSDDDDPPLAGTGGSIDQSESIGWAAAGDAPPESQLKNRQILNRAA